MKRLITSSSRVVGLRILGAATVYFSQVVIARWLGAEALGTYTFAFSTLVLLTIVTSLGFPAAAIRFIGSGIATEQGGKVKGFLRMGLGITVLGSVLAALLLYLLMISGWIPALYRWPLVIAMLSTPFYALLALQKQTALAFSWVDLGIIPVDVIRPVLFLLMLVLAWGSGQHFDINDVLLLQFVAIASVALVVFWIVSKRVGGYVSNATAQYEPAMWVSAASPLVLIVIYTNSFSELNMIIAASFLDAKELAIFNASFRTAFLIGFVVTAVDAITVPKASRLYAVNDLDACQRVISQATKIKSIGAISAILMLALFGQPLLSIFGADFKEGYASMLILALAMFFISSVGAVTEILTIAGYQKYLLLVYSVSSVLMVLLHAIFAPRFGHLGAAISVLCVVVFYSVWLRKQVIRKTGINPSFFGHQVVTEGEVRQA